MSVGSQLPAGQGRPPPPSPVSLPPARLRSLLPGSERGLIGAYFKVDGAIREPAVEALPLATFLTAVPSAIKAPMKVLQYLFNRDDRRDADEDRKDE